MYNILKLGKAAKLSFVVANNLCTQHILREILFQLSIAIMIVISNKGMPTMRRVTEDI